MQQPDSLIFDSYADMVHQFRLGTVPHAERGIHLLRVETIDEHALEFVSRYRNRFFELNLIRGQREFRFSIDGEWFAPDGTPYLCGVRPGQVQSCEVLGDDPDAEGYLLYLADWAVRQLRIPLTALSVVRPGHPPIQFLQSSQYEALAIDLERLAQVLACQGSLGEALAAVELFVAHSTRLLQAGAGDSNTDGQDKLRLAEAYIRSRLTNKLRIPDIASAVAMSERRFVDLVQTQLGLTPQGLIQRVQVAEAKALLHQPEVPITRIAYEVGFSEPAAFTRFFRRVAGCSPSEYRQRYIGQRVG